MKRAQTMSRIYLAVGIFAIVTAVAGLAGTVLFGLDKKYVLMAVCIALTVHGSYGAPFYFYNSMKAKVLMRICAEVRDGLVLYSEISERIGIREEIVRTYAEKCVNKKLLTGYEAAEDKFICHGSAAVLNEVKTEKNV